MIRHIFAVTCVLVGCILAAMADPPTTTPTSQPATAPAAPRTTVAYQKSRDDADHSNIVILHDQRETATESWSSYYALLVHTGADAVVFLGNPDPPDTNGRFLDAWLPPNGTLITVTCDSTATMYRASFCDGRPDRTFGDLLMFPEGTFKPDKPLHVKITGSLATKDETVTFWEDQHGWKWKFRFDPDAHKWVTEEKPKNLPFKVQYPLVNPP